MKPIKISLENTAKNKSKDLKEKVVSGTLVSRLASLPAIVEALSGSLALTIWWREAHCGSILQTVHSLYLKSNSRRDRRDT